MSKLVPDPFKGLLISALRSLSLECQEMSGVHLGATLEADCLQAGVSKVTVSDEFHLCEKRGVSKKVGKGGPNGGVPKGYRDAVGLAWVHHAAIGGLGEVVIEGDVSRWAGYHE